MNRRPIDALARLLAGRANRRTALKTLGGAAVAGGGAAAVILHSHSGGGAARADLGLATPIAAATRVPPVVTIAPGSGVSGAHIQAAFSGFNPGETVQVRIFPGASAAAAPLVSSAVEAGADGALAVSFEIPAQSPPGPNLIEGSGQTSGQVASVALNVACAGDLTACPGVCADLPTDPANCGACGQVCDAGDLCLEGVCTPHQIPEIDAFFAKYDGVCVDFDGVYGAQCMDLAEYYNRDVVGAPQIGGDAVDAWYYYSPSHYIEIENSGDALPQLGDLIVWDTDVGDGSGHIAICVSANQTDFTSFDQNWPTDSCCHYQNHDNYDAVLGWLRPKW